MPTKLQLESLSLCNHLFPHFLWKYPLSFDLKTSKFIYTSERKAILIWAFFETVFLFLGGFMLPLLILLVKVLAPRLMPKFSIINTVITAITAIVFGFCSLVGLSCYFCGADVCSAQVDLLNELLRNPISRKQFEI
jgi:hypothetical protein